MTALARRRPPLLLGLVALVLFVAGGASSADAKMKAKEWKEAEAKFRKLFAERGNVDEKIAIYKKIASDGSGRAWRVMAEGLFLEVQRWWDIQNELVEMGKEHATILQRSQKGFTPNDETRVQDLQEGMKLLEEDLRTERKALDAVTKLVTEGPEALRKNIIKRAKAGGEWPYRAAAVRVAVACMNEKGSWSYLQNTIENDKDPRVRLAGLDAIAGAKEKWEGIVLGRLGDPHWSVVLRAVRIIKEREHHAAVPHLINALNNAPPRLAEAVGDVLRHLTKENFDPFVDVWTQWWKDHKQDFESDVKLKKGKQKEFGDVHFYGVPIKSDRILFIIDISSSMKLPTKNDNPKERWKPPPTVTGKKGPPPPPPPEEILSGPKIDVAKHELKKAIKKLPKDTEFNIIAFNTGAVSWQKTMVEATKKNKESAFAWVRAMKPRGVTYIDGALRMGFTMAGLINYDTRYPDIHVDTILLLSDGAPTDNSMTAKLMDPEIILRHVREWNKNKTVVINCIGVDLVETIEFMRKLAEENGGVYVDR